MQGPTAMIKQATTLLLAGIAIVSAGAAQAQPYQPQPYAQAPYQPAPMQQMPGQPMPGMQQGEEQQEQMPPGGAPGQMPPQMAAMMHLAAQNQLGVLEYCQAQGYVGPDVVQLQRQQIATLPPVQVNGLAQAEAAGRQGTVDAGGRTMTLAQAAQAQGTSVAELCGKVGTMLRQQSSEMQGGGTEQAPQ